MTKKMKALFVALFCMGMLPTLALAQESVGGGYTPPQASDFTGVMTNTAGSIADAASTWVKAMFPILGGIMVLGFAVFFFIWIVRKLRQGVGR